jgi:hypothetical protein
MFGTCGFSETVSRPTGVVPVLSNPPGGGLTRRRPRPFTRKSSVFPKIPETIGTHLGIPHRVLNVLVSEIVLQRPGIAPWFASLKPVACLSMCGWIENGSLAALPSLPIMRRKPGGLIGASRLISCISNRMLATGAIFAILLITF